MLKIRLQRVGRKHDPSFRVLVTESTRGPKSGDFVEILGNYDARQKDKPQLNEERIKYWISKGAKLSDTVHNLLITHKIIEGKKINVLPKKSPQVSEEELKKQQEEKEKAKEESKQEAKEEKEETKKETKEDVKEPESSEDKAKEKEVKEGSEKEDKREEKNEGKEELEKETEKKEDKTEAKSEEKEKTEESKKIAPAKPIVKEEN